MVNFTNVLVEHNIVKDVAYEGIGFGQNRYVKMPTEDKRNGNEYY